MAILETGNKILKKYHIIVTLDRLRNAISWKGEKWIKGAFFKTEQIFKNVKELSKRVESGIF